MTSTKPKRERKICKVTYCELQVVRQGWCKRHYQQWYLTGRTRRNGHDGPLFRYQKTYAEVALRDLRGRIIAWSKIDKADVAKVSKHPWCHRHGGYAGSTGVGYLHRYVMDASPGQIVHHINRDRKDNRRSNLQLVDVRTNNRESIKARRVGVSKTDTGKWRAGITAVFSTRAEAVRMRDAWEQAAGWHD